MERVYHLREMSDTLYLSLWYPNLRLAAMPDKLVAVLGAFAAHGGEARVYSVTGGPGGGGGAASRGLCVRVSDRLEPVGGGGRARGSGHTVVARRAAGARDRVWAA